MHLQFSGKKYLILLRNMNINSNNIQLLPRIIMNI